MDILNSCRSKNAENSHTNKVPNLSAETSYFSNLREFFVMLEAMKSKHRRTHEFNKEIINIMHRKNNEWKAKILEWGRQLVFTKKSFFWLLNTETVVINVTFLILLLKWYCDTEPNNLTPFPGIRRLLIYIPYTNCANVSMKIKFSSFVFSCGWSFLALWKFLLQILSN